MLARGHPLLSAACAAHTPCAKRAPLPGPPAAHTGTSLARPDGLPGTVTPSPAACRHSSRGLHAPGAALPYKVGVVAGLARCGLACDRARQQSPARPHNWGAALAERGLAGTWQQRACPLAARRAAFLLSQRAPNRQVVHAQLPSSSPIIHLLLLHACPSSVCYAHRATMTNGLLDYAFPAGSARRRAGNRHQRGAKNEKNKKRA